MQHTLDSRWTITSARKGRTPSRSGLPGYFTKSGKPREGGELAGHDNSEDVAIWEAIASQSARSIDKLWDAIAEDIPKDTALREFQNSQEDILRLQLVMIDRANKWIQAVYDICSKECEKTGKPMAPNFDRAIWTFAIQRYIDQRLEELLLRAVGSPPNQRTQLRTWQRQCCRTVKGQISERWWNKLMMGRTEDQAPPIPDEPRPERNREPEAPARSLAEAAAVIAKGREWEAALRIARGLPATPLPTPLRTRVEDIVEDGPALDTTPSSAADEPQAAGAIPATEAVDIEEPKEILGEPERDADASFVRKCQEHPEGHPTMSRKQAARVLHRSDSTVRRWEDDGKLTRATEPGRVMTVSVLKWIEPRSSDT